MSVSIDTEKRRQRNGVKLGAKMHVQPECKWAGQKRREIGPYGGSGDRAGRGQGWHYKSHLSSGCRWWWGRFPCGFSQLVVRIPPCMIPARQHRRCSQEIRNSGDNMYHVVSSYFYISGLDLQKQKS